MKKSYKELKKKLKNKFTRPKGEYSVPSSTGVWFKQCGIKPTPSHLFIVCTILGSVPYPHQESDRLIIITYLNKTKYKAFKNDRTKNIRDSKR